MLRSIITSVAIAAVILGTCCQRGSARLNVVLVTFDALRADAVDSAEFAPHFAALSDNSVVFGQAISPFQSTPPSMPSLMTGLWPSFEGVPEWNPATFYGFTDLKSPEELDQPVLTENVRTLAEILVGHGWQTA
ncbi:MAG TPA: alkaline phosphatase family protein, partial [Acidimicrobiia bacterium]|nr:alkaline phosphatase family protein [Acidimicrobiia bacterium]